MECRLDNITIYYETFGEGRPIIMLHGSPADHITWVRLLEPIFKQRSGWKRIYPDLPGMGKTPGMDWITNQDDVLDVVLNFIDSVVPGQNVTVAGYSYGGYLAQGMVCFCSPLSSQTKEIALPCPLIPLWSRTTH